MQPLRPVAAEADPLRSDDRRGVVEVVDGAFDDENATCMVLSEQACVMLLARPFFATFTTKQVADAEVGTEAVLAVSAASRQDVDRLVDEALAGGATPAMPASDQGFVYGRSFYDLDGHAWEVMWMDPAVG